MSGDQSKRLAALFERHNIEARPPQGRWMVRLSPEDRTLIDEFKVWLIDVWDVLPSTAQPYSSYVARSLVEPEAELGSNHRAALQAFRAFIEDRDGAG